MSPNGSHLNERNGLDLSQGRADRRVPVADLDHFSSSGGCHWDENFPPIFYKVFFGVPVAPDDFGVTAHAPEYRDSNFLLYRVTGTTKKYFIYISH